MTLSFDQVKAHWERWAAEYGTSLRATTKTPTIKLLEIFALTQHIPPGSRVLDVGCGNGYNALSFVETVAGIMVTGVDYSPDMIANAQKNLQQNAASWGPLRRASNSKWQTRWRCRSGRSSTSFPPIAA
jgi:ubiquinone/menaquinone biosynthesis C-methylase UbiE